MKEDHQNERPACECHTWALADPDVMAAMLAGTRQHHPDCRHAPSDEPTRPDLPSNKPFCSFCGGRSGDLLVASPAAAVCTRCLEGAVDSLADQYGIPPEAVYGRIRADRLHAEQQALDALADAARVRATAEPVQILAPRGDARGQVG